jgi:DNA-directed RNA polymerase subunit RPC12/RpoP
MSEQELVLNVKELHVLSLACANCGHGTIFDFETKDYQEKMVSPKCAVCNTELEVDLSEQLNAYRCFYDSMSKCERVEFRVRFKQAEATQSASQVQEVVSTAVAEVQDAVTAAFAKEYAATR